MQIFLSSLRLLVLMVGAAEIELLMSKLLRDDGMLRFTTPQKYSFSIKTSHFPSGLTAAI